MITTHTPHEILEKYFGYNNFLPNQEEVIRSILNGNDTLVVMPTGGGKSVTFQVPAMILDGLTIVVSPLIALMKDQVDALKSNGIPAAFINSAVPYEEKLQIFEEIKEKKLKLLYISPEGLLAPRFTNYLKKLDVAFFAIDEAHCISAWGHDFRPEYTQMSILKDIFPDTPCMALTATADKITQQDITKQLNFKNPKIFIASFDRPNLSLNVFPARDRMGTIIDHMKEHSGQSGIIYCLSRASTEKISKRLNAAGFNTAFYHAGLEGKERNKIQEAFSNDDIPVICATIAFGMGIDKSNVRWVIHYNLPKNIEGYYQEIGRAGRDGLPAKTILFYSYGDVEMLRQFANDSGQPEIQLEKLNRIKQYAEAQVCRRKILLSYFNEHLEDDCGNCDVCRNPPTTFDGTVLAQKALSAIVRLRENVGMNMLIDVLRGSGRREIFEKGYHKIKTYGAGRQHSFFDWKQYLLQMLHQGLFDIAYDQHNTLKLSSLGKKVLFENKKINLTEPVNYKKQKAERAKRTVTLTKKQRLQIEMFERLKLLRKEIAQTNGVPPYIILSDPTLKELATARPTNKHTFLEIQGIGKHKTQEFGDKFITTIINFKIEVNDVGSTQLKTFLLYKDGLSLSAIGEERTLKKRTIVGHLAKLYQEGHSIDIYEFITEEEIEVVRNAVKNMTDTPTSLDVYNYLDKTMTLNKITFALAHINRKFID